MTMQQGSAAEAESLEDRKYELLFDIRRSVRYHDHRRSFYLRLHAFSNVGTLILGAGAIAVAFSEAGFAWMRWAAPALIVLIAFLDRGFSTVGNATLHADLYRRFIRLQQRTQRARPLKTEFLDGIETEMLEIEVEEPPVYHALNRACHNELLRSEGRPELFKTLRRHQRWLRNLLRFPNLPPSEARAGTGG